MNTVKLFVAVKAVIFNDKGEVLVIRESPKYLDSTQTGRFDVPGGRITPGESLDIALKREVMEETGLTVDVGSVFHVAEWRPVVKGEEWQIIGLFFKCKALSSQVVLSNDHDAYKWINPKIASDENVMVTHIELFKKL